VFITFEGPEGSGKTTQIERAYSYLQGKKLRVMCTREPGGTPIADRIRAILLHAESRSITPTAELFLYLASRAQHVEKKVRPALERGEIVLCDRFVDSTWAYQGYARRLGVELVERMNELAAGGLRPDVTLLYDLPVEVGLSRARNRAAGRRDAEREDRFENEAVAFHRQVREGFLWLARRDRNRFRIIDAAGDKEEVWKQTQKILDEILKGTG